MFAYSGELPTIYADHSKLIDLKKINLTGVAFRIISGKSRLSQSSQIKENKANHLRVDQFNAVLSTVLRMHPDLEIDS